MKKFIGLLVSIVLSSMLIISAYAQDLVSVDLNIIAIDSHLQKTISKATSVFEIKEVNNSTQPVPAELKISTYDISEIKQVHYMNLDFFLELEKGNISINNDNSVWYVPVVNAEQKNATVVFSRVNDEIIPSSLIIPQTDVAQKKVFGISEIQKILEDNNISPSVIQHFVLPTKCSSAISAYITTDDGSKYVLIIDTKFWDPILQSGGLYSIDELKAAIL